MPSAAHSVLVELSPDEIEHRLTLLKGGIDPDAAELLRDEVVGPELSSLQYAHYTPWVSAADEYIQWASTPQRRVYTGIDEFDTAMRGLAPSELLLVVGYAHSGKTVFTTKMLLHNHDKRVALFTPDETRVLVLVKMASILHGVSAEELEERLAAGDSETEQLLRDVALEHFPKFAVFDELSDLHLMDRALTECEEVWGGKAQLVVIDYLDLVSGQGEDVPSKLNAVKSWGKRREIPLVVLHQASRSSGAAGKKMGISSGGFGGEQQATFMVGVRRKKQQYSALIEEIEERLASAQSEATIARLNDALVDARYELERHKDTITFSLVKNKRPPSRLVEDTDFVLNPDTGQVVRFDGAPPRHATYQATVAFQQGSLP